MYTIADIVQKAGETSIVYFWMPFLIWTIISFFAFMILKSERFSHPILLHNMYLALLLSLPFVFVSSQIITFSLPESYYSLTTTTLPIAVTGSGAEQAEAVIAPTLSIPALLVGLLNLVVIMLAAVNLIKLAFSYTAQLRFRSRLLPIADPEVLISFNNIKQTLLPDSQLEIRENEIQAIPLTFGWFRPVIVLPSQQYTLTDLNAVLLHEMIHVRRGDYLLKSMQEVIRAIFIINPLVLILSRKIDDFREMACDAEVLTHQTISPSDYASLLLASVCEPTYNNPLYSSMTQTKPKLMQRISAMNKYNLPKTKYNRIRRISLAFSGCLALLVIFVSSCDFSGLTSKVEEEQESVNNQEEEIFMVVEQMPEPIGGIQAIYENLSYPDAARQAGIEGRVSVQFTVDTDGTVKDAVVLRGIGGGADEEAVNAIMNTEWVPGQQRGQAVPVRFVYTVQFRLSSSE